jgi:hypothetical protein
MFRPDGSVWMVDTNAPLGPWSNDIRCPNLEPFPRTRITPLYQPDLSALAHLLEVVVDPEFDDALFTPPDNGRFLWFVPGSLTHALVGIADIEATAHAWRTAPRDDWDDFDVDQDHWATCLSSLVKLASHAVAQELSLYCYQGPEPHP